VRLEVRSLLTANHVPMLRIRTARESDAEAGCAQRPPLTDAAVVGASGVSPSWCAAVMRNPTREAALSIESTFVVCRVTEPETPLQIVCIQLRQLPLSRQLSIDLQKAPM
jgi:hypothetical protein